MQLYIRKKSAICQKCSSLFITLRATQNMKEIQHQTTRRQALTLRIFLQLEAGLFTEELAWTIQITAQIFFFLFFFYFFYFFETGLFTEELAWSWTTQITTSWKKIQNWTLHQGISENNFNYNIMEQKLQFESELLIEELAWTQNYNSVQQPPATTRRKKRKKTIYSRYAINSPAVPT